MRRIVFHIDVNSAYLSWTAVEQLKNGAETDIRTIPAIIGGNQESRHGVVLAKSLPAKKFGIRTGEPVANAFRKCASLHMEPPDHKLYHEYSGQMMTFLRTYTPDIEQVSVDECYMDFTGISGRFTSPVSGALEIKNRIYEKFGFTVNIGISTNKLLAKMASDFEKPDKVHTLFPEEIKVKMWPLPVWELYMAGQSSVETLQKLEIRSIGDLAQADPEILELHLKSHGRKLWEFANGIDNSEVITEKVEAKGIGNSTTLSKDAVTEEEAKKVLLGLAESVGARLREAEQKAGMLSVEIKYYNFETASHQRQIPKPTNSDTVIYHTAVELFRELWTKAPIRLLGIRSSKLVKQDEPEQMTIFDIPVRSSEETDTARDEKQKKLDRALDEIKKKYGRDAVRRGRLLEAAHGKEQGDNETH
ncbi:Y-family DNA polymerase [[Clostridium] hylemonae]|uniref:Y-family DNA polymerase n=1 Tax=[Clostridium] hylemonae TaxID=89153 RepID=UPI001FCAC398|nr:DNA polymerase IV [[Clostridium] hylemonae]BDF05688.1 DNA polymerase IV [[Clostridium] hylemonae]